MAATPETKTLLIELLCEELPPKVLSTLGKSFALEIYNSLLQAKLITTNSEYQWFATPRRLAFSCKNVFAQANDDEVNEKIMPVSIAIDQSGNPTPALIKKLESKNFSTDVIKNFTREFDGKKETFFYKVRRQGDNLQLVLAEIIKQTLNKLPIPKMMRWSDTDFSFIRPVHKLLILHGSEIINAEILGVKSGRETSGHRFLTAGNICLANSEQYQSELAAKHVIADYAKRREIIAKQLQISANNENAILNYHENLLDEVCALVEWPKVYVGEFPVEYLEVPQECLILTMQQNQKYFPLFDQKHKLLNRFLIVSNMEIDDAKFIIDGNARVIKPRLADARFFYQQDSKTPLVERINKLQNVVYHNKLGSQGQRIKRIENIALAISKQLNFTATEITLTKRAAILAKADLVTDMVGEFPELQGTMGAYYAKNDNEPPEVISAIAEHYRPRFSGDALPTGKIATIIALADKLESLTGLFSINQIPTGDKDPFALRRSALGVIRLIIENKLEINFISLIQTILIEFKEFSDNANCLTQLNDFLLERLKNWLREQNFRGDIIDAVLRQKTEFITEVIPKINAVNSFIKLEEAATLIAVHKRIGNILKKNSDEIVTFNPDLLEQTEEINLYSQLNKLNTQVNDSLITQDYQKALSALAILENSVNDFFDKVLVNSDNLAVKNNRISLLNQLFNLLNSVADLSSLELNKSESA